MSPLIVRQNQKAPKLHREEGTLLVNNCLDVNPLPDGYLQDHILSFPKMYIFGIFIID